MLIWQLPDDIFLRAALSPPSPDPGSCAGVPAVDAAHAQSGTGEPVWRHALSLFGDVKYPADFKASITSTRMPQGRCRRADLIGTFDNFNLAVAGRQRLARLRGRAHL